MIVCKTVPELKIALQTVVPQGGSIGYVPTMGALHEGHLSLIRQSAAQNSVTVCSIFVNPIQFNNPEDLVKYPRTPERDIALIEPYCQVAFMPSVKEMFPDEVSEKFSFGELESVMEGACRPGHFNGVAVIVSRFFAMIQPDRAYFGEKDFQQLQIIRAMTEQLALPIEIVGCNIIREADGLAKSSRNVRLSDSNRALSPFIYQTLQQCKQRVADHTPDAIIEWAQSQFLLHPEFKTEYIEIAEENTLQHLNSFSTPAKARIFVAVWIGGVRLIDNLSLIN
jgi:pantoate--beta-alanine ligase